MTKHETWNLQVEILHAGQTGPYTDSVYQYTLTFTNEQDKHNWRPTRAKVLEYLEVVFGGPFYDEGYEREQWHKPYLQELKEGPTGVWYAHIRRLYND
jgi:hypothetical protein